MALSCGLLVYLAAIFIVGVSTSPPAQVVDVGYAKYMGTLDATTNNTHFLGMRYAAPPTANLRWQAPQTPSTADGIQQANVQPPMCPQVGPALSTSEDCLFLNVYVPSSASTRSRKLPVVVWIHGGGYVEDGASSFNGDDLLLFGFLAGNEVKARGVLNAGLLDQEFALRWVQEHIAKFGGDPAQVTIWGESAGAGSVLQHVIAHDGKTRPPLFRGAMTSSTFLPSQYGYNDPIPEALFRKVVSQANCSSATDSLACLRNAGGDILEKVDINIGSTEAFGPFVFAPVVDGTFITQRPTEALRQRKINGKVVLAVTNAFEGAFFVDPTTASTIEIPTYVGRLFPNFGPQEIAAATAQYQGLGSPIFQAIAIMGESIYICPTYFLLRAFNGRSFKGEFAIPPGNHGDDLSYYFPSRNAGGVPAFNNTAFDKAFPESFLNFAMSLDPNVKWDPSNITPRWGVWGGEVEMLFNRTDEGGPDIRPIDTSGALLARCNFWESVGALSGQ